MSAGKIVVFGAGEFRPKKRGLCARDMYLGMAAMAVPLQKKRKRVLTGICFGGTLTHLLDESWLTNAIWERSI